MPIGSDIPSASTFLFRFCANLFLPHRKVIRYCPCFLPMFSSCFVSHAIVCIPDWKVSNKRGEEEKKAVKYHSFWSLINHASRIFWSFLCLQGFFSMHFDSTFFRKCTSLLTEIKRDEEEPSRKKTISRSISCVTQRRARWWPFVILHPYSFSRSSPLSSRVLLLVPPVNAQKMAWKVSQCFKIL